MIKEQGADVGRESSKMRRLRIELKMSIAAFGMMDVKSHDTQERCSD